MGYINNIETGKTKPSLEGFYIICEYLAITPSAFFDAETQNPHKLNQVMADLKKLNDEQLDIIAALLRQIVD